MNYHLMPDDKFIDDFIDDAESVSKGLNTYIIEGNRENAKHSKHTLISFVPSLAEYLKKITTHLTPKDQVFIHWLDERLFDFILSLSPEIKVGLFFWGGDIVELPREIYARDNYEHLSLKYYRKYQQPYPTWIKLYKNPLNILRHIKWKWQYNKRIQENFNKKLLVLARLNYFLTWSPEDYQWVKSRVKNFNAEYKYHFYGVGELTGIPLVNTHQNINEKKSLVLWLGNSATLSNNHLDAFKVLSRFKKHDVTILCPLSYGEPVESHYTQLIIKTGKKIFGKKFQPITQFLNRKEYYKLFQEVDVVVMFHNRTQAAGNIRTFMQMGKKIFMQKQSTIFQLFKNAGAVIFDNHSLQQMSIQELSTPLSEKEKLKNLQVLNQIINHEKKMESLSVLLNNSMTTNNTK